MDFGTAQEGLRIGEEALSYTDSLDSNHVMPFAGRRLDY